MRLDYHTPLGDDERPDVRRFAEQVGDLLLSGVEVRIGTAAKTVGGRRLVTITADVVGDPDHAATVEYYARQEMRSRPTILAHQALCFDGSGITCVCPLAKYEQAESDHVAAFL